MNLVYSEYLFAPLHQVAFFEQFLELTDAHAIRHTELGNALTVVTVTALPHLFLIFCTHLCRSYADAAVGVLLYDCTKS